MKKFDKGYVFKCKVYNNAATIENARCELLLNEVNTDYLLATITFPQPSHAKVKKILDSGDLIKVEDIESNINYKLEGKFCNFNSGLEIGECLKLKVENCEITKFYSNDSISKFNFVLYIDDTLLYKNRQIEFKHYKKGFLKGWNPKDDLDDPTGNWTEQKDIISTEFGKLSILPSYLFGKDNDFDLNKEFNFIYNQQIMELCVTGKYLELSDIHNRIIEEIEKYLKMISFIEGEWINWNQIKIFGSNSEDCLIFERNIFRKNRSFKRKKRDQSHYSKYQKSYHHLLEILVKNFDLLNDNTKEFFNTILRRFIVSSVHDKIDTQIIYIHSCLDVCIKGSKIKGDNFTKRLLKACDDNEVDYLDLFPYLIEADVYKKRGIQLKLNVIRNEMIHDGEYLKDYSTAISEVNKSKALCERFLLKILNIAYEGTGFGI